MGLLITDISYFSVLIAGIVGMVIGALWYSPLLFGNLWIALMGFTEKDITAAKNKNMTLQYALQFVALLVVAYVLSLLIASLGINTIPAVFQLAFWLWLGFQATLELSAVLWGGKSWSLFLLNSAHNLVVLAFMSWVLFLFA